MSICMIKGIYVSLAILGQFNSFVLATAPREKENKALFQIVYFNHFFVQFLCMIVNADVCYLMSIDTNLSKANAA